MPHRQQVVCQQLENIDRIALEKYQHLIRKCIRGRNGIYSLHHDGKPCYVGLARCQVSMQ